MSVALTPAEGKLLRLLQDRQRAGLSSHAAWAYRARTVIVGPDLPGGRIGYAALRTSADSLRALRRYGLIEPPGPQEFLGDYARRRRGDGTSGEAVRLTDVGKRTCACGAQDLDSAQVEFCATASGRDHAYRPRNLS